MKDTIAIIGGGAMGAAVADGLLASGITAETIRISNPHTAKLAPLAEKGVTVTESNSDAIKGSKVVVIAVKPRVLPVVASELQPFLKPETEVCVIVAGVSGNEIEKMFPVAKNLSIVMPNTAVALCESMTFIVPLRGECGNANEIFSLTGNVMSIPEHLLPAATALASCGIAYGMRYVRAACEGGVELGFRASQAQTIVVQTLKGVAALLTDTSRHPEAEIDRVTTPGGFTIRGLNAMERNGFTNSVIEGLKASVK